MDFDLKPEHRALQKSIHEFMQEEVKPLVKQIDRDSRVPDELLKKAGAAGLFGIPFSQKYGGMGAGEIGYCILMEEMVRGRQHDGHHWRAHRHRRDDVVSRWHRRTQQRYLPDLCSGKRSPRLH
jgi:alkylation response protein AidB-like acyl-CoA dehydrogenase